MVVRAYGFDWDYNLYMISDRTAERVQKLMDEGEWKKAYELILQEDKTSSKYVRRKDWHSLDTIDLLTEYVENVTV
jgi:hypothetical protein